MRKVLVTGGLGFIGSHTVVELVKKGYEPIIVDNLSNSKIGILERLNEICGSKINLSQFNLLDLNKVKELFEAHKFDSIIHFAASKAVGESVENPLLYYQNNLITLTNLLEVSKEYGLTKFIFSSSCTVYGQPDRLPVTEETPKKPAESPYGNTKQVGEEIIEDFCNSFPPFRAISLRYFNPIGAHESGRIGELPLGAPNNLVPYITQTAIGIRNTLKVFGGDYDTPDGTCIRDYIHVVDLANAHIKAMEFLHTSDRSYDVFNIGTGEGSSVLQVIKSFEKVSDLKLNYEITDRRPGDVEQIFAQTDKVKEVLGWESEHDLDQMMSSAWKWQQSLKEDPVN